MKKRLIVTLLGLVLLVAALAGVKMMQIGAMVDQGKKLVPPPETVTSAVVTSDLWKSELSAIGTLTAVQGGTVAAELPGKVVKILFEPGRAVKKGDLLVSQDTAAEEAELMGAEAQVKVAKADLDRAGMMIRDRIISQADYDKAQAAHEGALSKASSIRVAIDKKNIRAPFSGRLGIRQINLGQILKDGDPIVTLQTLDPIFVDFTLPQQQVMQLRVDLPVKVICDALPGVAVEGRITAINPLVESETRNAQIQATVFNREERLRPACFVCQRVGWPVHAEQGDDHPRDGSALRTLRRFGFHHRKG